VTVPALRELGLTPEQEDLVLGVRAFVDGEVIPRAARDEAADRYPKELVDGLRELGFFGLTIPERYGGSGIDLVTYCLAVEELARGWMSLAGIVNTHFIVSSMILESGTEEQRARLLPVLAAGRIRGAFSMSEPHCGSDVQAIRTIARRDGDSYVIDGRKMWVTNGLRAGVVAVLVKTDPTADPPHRGMTAFLLEKEPGAEHDGGITVPPPLHKLGYRGVETTELVLDAHRVPAGAVLGGDAGVGRGFQQMMSGIEVGRANVAARGVGVARRAFELALRYAREREAFGKPLTGHQAIQFRLAEMATQIEAARLLTARAARAKQEGRRADLETGMAKLFASEACRDCVEHAMRIHGGYGYSTEYEIERLYRDAPLLLVGEGTSEIQKTIIARSLVAAASRA
jgi:butyryl-CoA dehydrogenase